MKRLLVLLLILLFCSPLYAANQFSGVKMSGAKSGGSAAVGCAISDDMSLEATESNYYDMRDGDYAGTAIAAGVMKANGSRDSLNVHTTTTGNDNHCVQADITTVDLDDNAGLVLRVSAIAQNATGYRVVVGNNQILFAKFTGYSFTSVGSLSVAWSYVKKNLRVCVSGNSFSFYVDGVEDNESPITDATYATGSYVGTFFTSNGGGASVDNFYGDPASTCMP